MLIDTHCHLYDDAYDADRAAVIARALEAEVGCIVIPAVNLPTCALANALTQQFPSIYMAAGVHPVDTAQFDTSLLPDLEAYARRPKVVAIGEIGLDYHWDLSPKERQFAAIEAQLALAARLELPVILHNRESSEDLMAILRTWTATLPPALQGRAGVLHSFSASQAVADEAVQLGFYLGFTGPLTYKNADDLRAIAGRVPLDRLLVETDGPYLTPTPHRGKRNEPAYVRLTADRLAALHGLDIDTFATHTTANAKRLFNLPDSLGNVAA
jgi:TatD DNase family protein